MPNKLNIFILKNIKLLELLNNAKTFLKKVLNITKIIGKV